jgi:hypothetical protein
LRIPDRIDLDTEAALSCVRDAKSLFQGAAERGSSSDFVTTARFNLLLATVIGKMRNSPWAPSAKEAKVNIA